MAQRVRASLARADCPACPHLLVGFSGGRDSLALTVIAAALARAGALTAELVHVDHAFRAMSSDDATGVAAIGDALGLRTHVVTLEPDATSRHPGVGAEEALRRERYRAFAQVARGTNAWAIALAHHQRDQAETVLLHLMRGSGLSGAAGMREWSEITVPWWSDQIGEARPLRVWRPFLGERFEEVAAVAAGSGLPIHEDETNEDRRFRRNAVRHDVLPLLEAIAPGATSSLARFAALAAEDEAVIEGLVQEALQGRLIEQGAMVCDALLRLPQALQRRVVRRWVFDSGYDGDLTANRIDAVLQIAERNRSGARVEIGAGWSVRLEHGGLALRR